MVSDIVNTYHSHFYATLMLFLQRDLGGWLHNHCEFFFFYAPSTRTEVSCFQIGGCQNGGYVNDAQQTNPTFEFFPSRGDPIGSPILARTLPTNLYPLTWLLPSGNLLIQSNWETVVLDYKANKEYPLDNIPDAVRTVR